MGSIGNLAGRILTLWFLVTDLIKRGELKPLEEYQQLRSNVEAYEQFCDSFLPCIIGKTRWAKEVYTTEVSKIASPNDEAWALLVLENSWELWHQIADHEMRGEVLPKIQCKKTRWTSGAISASKYEGWGSEGMERYNNLVQMVRDDRNRNRQFDAEFLKKKKEEKDTQLSGKKRRRDDADRGLGFAIECDMTFIEGWEGDNGDGEDQANTTAC